MVKNKANPVFLFFQPEYVKTSSIFNPVLTKAESKQDIELMLGQYLLRNASKEDYKDAMALNLLMDKIFSAIKPTISMPTQLDPSRSDKWYVNLGNGIVERFSPFDCLTPKVEANNYMDSDLAAPAVPLCKVLDSDINTAVDAITNKDLIITLKDIDSVIETKWFKVKIGNNDVDLGIIILKEGFGNILSGAVGITHKAKICSNILRSIYLDYIKNTDIKTVFNSGLFLKYMVTAQIESPEFINRM